MINKNKLVEDLVYHINVFDEKTEKGKVAHKLFGAQYAKGVQNALAIMLQNVCDGRYLPSSEELAAEQETQKRRELVAQLEEPCRLLTERGFGTSGDSGTKCAEARLTIRAVVRQLQDLEEADAPKDDEDTDY